MEALLLFIELFIAPAVPPTYQFDQNRQKIFKNQTTFTAPNCRDYAMLQLKNNTDNYLFLSRCAEEWRLTHTDGSSQSLESQTTPFTNSYLTLRPGEGLWFVRISDRERLLYLSSKGLTEIRDFRQLEGGWILQTSGVWFLVRDSGNRNAELIRLAAFEQNNERNTEYWNALSGGGYLASEKLLALVFYLGGERHFSLYDTASESWSFKPPELLLPEERRALQQGQNVIFRLAVPPGSARLYYDIYSGSEHIGRSAFHYEGESVIFTCKLQPGRHLIKLDRFTALTSKNDAKFVREKNIHQFEPISVNIPANRAVLIYVRPGKKNENKPLALDYSYLPQLR